jgi:hypothetical protein
MFKSRKEKQLKKEMKRTQEEMEQKAREDDERRKNMEEKREMKNRRKAMTVPKEFVEFNNERIDNVDKVMEGFKKGEIDHLYTPQPPETKEQAPGEKPGKKKKKDLDIGR